MNHFVFMFDNFFIMAALERLKIKMNIIAVNSNVVEINVNGRTVFFRYVYYL